MNRTERERLRTEQTNANIQKIADAMERESDVSFSVDAPTAALRLSGATLKVGEREITIVDAKGFVDGVNMTNLASFRAAQAMPIGTITATEYRGSGMPNITVKDRGLVMIIKIQTVVDGKTTTINGPGRIGKLLGIKPGESRQLIIEGPKQLRMEEIPHGA